MQVAKLTASIFQDRRSKFIVTDKSLPFTIALYSIAAIATLLLLTWRRYSIPAGKVCSVLVVCNYYNIVVTFSSCNVEGAIYNGFLFRCFIFDVISNFWYYLMDFDVF